MRKIDDALTRKMYVTDKMSIAQIAKHFSVTEAGIYTSLKRQGIALNRKGKAKSNGRPVTSGAKKMWIRRLHQSGMSRTAIAKKLKISEPTIRKYLREYGLLGKPVKQAKPPKQKPVVVQVVKRPWYGRLFDWFRS